MPETLLVREQPSPHATLLRRACDVFVAPVRTFASFRSAPRWFDALALATLLVGISTYAFSASDTGARLLAERRAMFAEVAGRHLSAEQYAASIAREQHGATLAAVIAGAWLVVLALVVAAGALTSVHVLSALGALRAPVMPSARFSQALAIVAHAALIPALAMPFRLLLNLWRGAVGPSTSVGILLPFLPSDTVWAHLGNSIDLFGLWWAYTLAVGFAVVFLHRPAGLRLLFLSIYLLVAVARAVAKTLAGAPSF